MSDALPLPLRPNLDQYKKLAKELQKGWKAETLPTVEFFKRNNKCVQVDTSQDRQTVYALVYNNLAEYTDRNLAAKPLTERAEILLGLRAYPPSPGRRTLKNNHSNR